MSFKIVAFGSRKWKDRLAVEHWIWKLCKEAVGNNNWGMATLVQGEAPGADSLARESAHSLGLRVRSYPAKWYVDGKYDPGAGVKRNQLMLDDNPDIDIGVAFVRNDLPCKGTWDMFDRCLAAGVPVVVVPGTEEAGNEPF